MLCGSRRTGVQHNSLSLYIFLRGITLLIRCGNNATARDWLHTLLTPTRMTHGDTLLMCIASAQILYSFVVVPKTMPRSYVNFITRHALKPRYVWEAIRVSSFLAHACHTVHILHTCGVFRNFPSDSCCNAEYLFLFTIYMRLVHSLQWKLL